MALLKLMGNGKDFGINNPGLEFFAFKDLEDQVPANLEPEYLPRESPGPPFPFQADYKPAPLHSRSGLGKRNKPASRRTKRKRWWLPLSIDGQTSPATVMACPDTGSDETIIRFDLAKRLGLEIWVLDEKDQTFALAKRESVANSAFPERWEFTVHVFESMVVPAILGAAFLEDTETLTTYRDRLVGETVPSTQLLRVSSVGRPKKGLVCRLDTFVGCVIVDTGSDLDLVSPEFVNQRGLTIREDNVEMLEFADGSRGETCGSVD
ncbi:hypothetical protein N658DRAFT_527725, partial [Parathielavia hyrcaniae]